MRARGMSTLMKFLQIHSAVHAGDLIAIAVKHNGGPHEDFAEAALLGLAPPRMVNVGKIDAAVLSLGHLAGVIESLEGDVACFRRRLDELCEDAEGETDPRHNDGPAFDATMAVDAFFEWSEFQDFVYGELAWLGDVTFNGNVPR